MSKNRYYYFDHEACAFVEHKASRTKLYVQVASTVVIALVLAGVITWGMDHMVETPQEFALKAENEVLQQKLTDIGERMEEFSDLCRQLVDVI